MTRTGVWFNKTFSTVHNALRLIRAGDEEGRYTLLCSSTNPHAAAFLAADAAAVEPHGLTGTAYVDWCLAFCQARRVGILVPGKEAVLIGEHADAFLAAGTRVLAAGPAASLHLLHDKAAFYRDTCDLSVPSPECLGFADWASFEAAYASLRERHAVLCMKPATSVYGIGFRRIVEDRPAFALITGDDPYSIDLASLSQALKAVSTCKPMLLMPFLDGHEYSVDCVAAHGELVCAVARKKPLDATHGQVIDTRADIQAACAELVGKYRLNGNVNIQFREGRDGLRILEINPRMSGGIGMASLAGPNLPYLAVAVFDRGRAAVAVPAVEAGLRVGEVLMPVCLP